MHALWPGRAPSRMRCAGSCSSSWRRRTTRRSAARRWPRSPRCSATATTPCWVRPAARPRRGRALAPAGRARRAARVGGQPASTRPMCSTNMRGGACSDHPGMRAGPCFSEAHPEVVGLRRLAGARIMHWRAYTRKTVHEGVAAARSVAAVWAAARGRGDGVAAGRRRLPGRAGRPGVPAARRTARTPPAAPRVAPRAPAGRAGPPGRRGARRRAARRPAPRWRRRRRRLLRTCWPRCSACAARWWPWSGTGCAAGRQTLGRWGRRAPDWRSCSAPAAPCSARAPGLSGARRVTAHVSAGLRGAPAERLRPGSPSARCS